jgi:ribose transport system substrate-binding protein
MTRKNGRSRSWAALGTALAVVVMAAGCGSDDSGGDASAESGGSAKTTTIGTSMPFLSADFEVVLQKYFVNEATKNGLKSLAPTNADMDSGKQISDIRNLISGGAKGLMVVANDSKAIIPALDYAQKNDVKVVSADIGPDGGKVAMIVRADNVRMGRQACDEMAKLVGGKGKVLSLMGAFTSINGRDRSLGFRACMKEHPQIDLIERATDWDATKQVAALQTVLNANPDLKGVYMQSDYALAASLNVLKKAGKTAKAGEPGHIATISIDATPQGLNEIRKGTLDVEISQPADLYAKYGMRYLKQALDGATFKPGPTDHGSRIVLFNGNPMDLLPAVVVSEENVDDASLWGNQK